MCKSYPLFIGIHAEMCRIKVVAVSTSPTANRYKGCSSLTTELKNFKWL